MCAYDGKSATKTGAREIPREHHKEREEKIYATFIRRRVSWRRLTFITFTFVKRGFKQQAYA